MVKAESVIRQRDREAANLERTIQQEHDRERDHQRAIANALEVQKRVTAIKSLIAAIEKALQRLEEKNWMNGEIHYIKVHRRRYVGGIWRFAVNEKAAWDIGYATSISARCYLTSNGYIARQHYTYSSPINMVLVPLDLDTMTSQEIDNLRQLVARLHPH